MILNLISFAALVKIIVRRIIEWMNHNNRWFIILVMPWVTASLLLILAIVASGSTFLGKAWVDLLVNITGATVGSIIAIVGALLIERHNRNSRKRNELLGIFYPLRSIHAACAEMAQWTQQPSSLQTETLDRFADGIDLLDFSLRTAPIHDAELWIGMVKISELGASHKGQARNLASKAILVPWNECQSLQSVSAQILPLVVRARERWATVTGGLDYTPQPMMNNNAPLADPADA